MICELLAPAGNLESLKAAVENGADAVYLGGRIFNARQNAENFNDNILQEAIEYAKLRDVKIYLTLNTLVSDEEIKTAAEYAAFAYSCGIDAVIVQDLGLSRVLKNNIPDLPLHASTQMSIYNLNGVNAAKELGFSRVVTARELSLDELSTICKDSGVEIEAFVHGALCVSYSGQCLMSSFCGGRSGNRGLCAQPCRMKYELLNDKGLMNRGYLLSTRDLKTIDFIDSIVKAGVRSLKIEGRMKTPEYVGIVVSKYRKALDLLSSGEEDERELMQIFNRGGFSTGYFFGKDNKKLVYKELPKNIGLPIGTVLSVNEKYQSCTLKLCGNIRIGDGIEILNKADNLPGGLVTGIVKNGERVKEAFDGDTAELSRIRLERGKVKKGDLAIKTSDKALNERVRTSWTNPSRTVDARAVLRIKNSEPIRLDIIKGDFTVSSEGAVPEKAVNKGVTEERAAEQISKDLLPIRLSEIDMDIDDGLFVPVKALNELRRNALTGLKDKITEGYRRNKPEIYFSGRRAKKVQAEKSSLFFYIYDDFRKMSVLFDRAERAYVPVSWFLNEDAGREIIRFSDRLDIIPYLPAVTKGKTDNLLPGLIRKLVLKYGVKGFMIGNLGQIDLFRGNDVRLYGDIGLNVYNSSTAEAAGSLGLCSITSSPETKDSIAVPEGVECEKIVFGRIPVMTSEFCALGACTDCNGDKRSCMKNAGIRIRNAASGSIFPCIFEPIDCRMTVLSDKEIMYNRKDGFNVKRINIFHNEPEDILNYINYGGSV